ncbi:hypothetical protein PMZ80_010201 [Knufia obscura]|uniref:Uncharacterized protein n=1 Tax=Knufia obscura TaxID=1635080 RepID=A0ABR0RAI3_9EURO|nr:hypothetical protein PMZ80_010201 [Knufia obscura]
MAQSASNITGSHYATPEPPILPSDNGHVIPLSTRRPYRRQKSWASPSVQYEHIDPQHDDVDSDNTEARARGLGLSEIPLQNARPVEVKRVPVGSRGYSTTTDSPEVGRADGFSQATTAQNTGNTGSEGTPWPPAGSSQWSSDEAGYRHMSSDVDLLPHDHGVGCPTQGDLLKTQWTGFTIMIVFMAVYSTFFSAIFLVIALAKPRWGHHIGPRGALSYDSATLLSAFFSKSVELTFATTYVATLGQILTRRAFAKSYFSRAQKGISIAEMNMRLWIMQPGTLVTHWSGARYVVTSLLGISALIAAFAAAFYTTAAESLVSPKLKFGQNETLTMFGEVKSSYANAIYLSDACSTPITEQMDPDAHGTTCLQIDFAGNAFRNLDTWLATWHNRAKSSENVEELSASPRPPPVAILYENTTVYGQWITPSKENITADSEAHGRLFHNVTLVMPHANVFHAARSPKNQILQPEDLQGAGEYYIKAAVPVPGINVLCVGATEADLAPLITQNDTGEPPDLPVTSDLDGLFQWAKEPNETHWAAPWFSKLPKEYNTLVNTSTTYGPQAVYMLGKRPTTAITSDYMICAVRSFLYSDCSTSYHVAQSGGQLSVHCGDDPEKWTSYSQTRKQTELEFPMVIPSKDWKDVAQEWIRAVALSSGNVDSDASASRLMTQMFPPGQTAPPHISTQSNQPSTSQFVHYWDYALNAFTDEPAVANFSAILSYKDYSSGGDKNWKGIFYLILIAVFAQNCFCLFYLLWTFYRDGELTDYTEPQNLFALAINSPPSQMLAGACGGGPKGEMLKRKWCVDMSLDREHEHEHDTSYRNDRHGLAHPHFYVKYPDEDIFTTSPTTTSAANSPNMYRASPRSPAKSVSWSPLVDLKSRRRSKTPRPRSMHDFNVDESPAVAQYMRLIGR